jgi:hypothetical protein
MRDHQPDEDVKGNTDPVRTHVPGRWRITLSNVRPEGSWREHLLERARPIPRPRPRQKTCSSRCRWALWKAGRQTAAQAHVERDRHLRDLLREALNVLEKRGAP